MNPTDFSPGSVRTEADGSVVVELATDPRRPPVALDATIRHPGRFRAALGAFLGAMAADRRPLTSTRSRLDLAADPPRSAHTRPPLASDRARDVGQPRRFGDAIVTVAADAWILEGFAADQSAYAQIQVDHHEINQLANVQFGTAGVRFTLTFADSLGAIRDDRPVRLQLRLDQAAGLDSAAPWPGGWLRGFSGMMAALSLPTRRIALDRGGLFGLITALGRSRTVRASRSVVVRWEPGRGAEVVVRPGSRPVPLHARGSEAEPAGSVRVAVGQQLSHLAGLLPWVDSASLFLLGPGLPSFWALQLGGIRVLLGLPGWTADDRCGSLSLDPLEPPTNPARFRANQVAATWREHPAQTCDQIVERTRGDRPEVAAVLTQFAARGWVLPDPESGLCRWRAAFADPELIAAAPEVDEVAAARAIVATTSVQVTRDETRADGKGRRIEGTILDRPVTIDLDGDGWMARGHCTCSHHPDRGLRRRGPCRHQLALQAQVAPRLTQPPLDLAGWLSGFPMAMTPT